MNDSFKDYYKILGVTPRATFENIRSAAEHELSQNWNNAMGRLEIQEAYEVLSDPKKRKEYDEEFNKRLNEREVAIRNARTFEEYVAATSLYSELANVDMAPEVEVPQEEIIQVEVNNVNTGSVSETSKSVEEEKEEFTTDSFTGSDYSESSNEDTQLSQDNEEETEEQIDEQLAEEELEEEIEEEEKDLVEEPREEQTIQELNQEPKQEFINIPIQRLDKEITKPNESLEDKKEEIDDKSNISKDAVRELIRAAIIAGGVGVGALIIGGIPGVVLGLMAGVSTGDFFKKNADKIKLERKPKFQKESQSLEIKDINTQETQFLNEYSQNLENEIFDLLDKPNKNYELEIAIRKYENLIELTNKRINFKVSESQKGNSIFKKMEIKSLKDKLNRLNKTLMLLNEKKQTHQDKKTPRLSKINQELSNLSHEVSKVKNEQFDGKVSKEEIIDDLMLKKSSLLEKRDSKANRMYVNKDLISFGQVTLVKLNSAKNIVKSTVDKFINLAHQEEIEQANIKSL